MSTALIVFAAIAVAALLAMAVLIAVASLARRRRNRPPHRASS